MAMTCDATLHLDNLNFHLLRYEEPGSEPARDDPYDAYLDLIQLHSPFRSKSGGGNP